MEFFWQFFSLGKTFLKPTLSLWCKINFLSFRCYVAEVNFALGFVIFGIFSENMWGSFNLLCHLIPPKPYDTFPIWVKELSNIG